MGQQISIEKAGISDPKSPIIVRKAHHPFSGILIWGFNRRRQKGFSNSGQISHLSSSSSSMKILEANAGPLTNFEVLDFLRSKGAAKDPTRVLARVAKSEYKVYDYLVQTPACNQTRESINEFVEKSKKYDLAKAEILNIINLQPITPVEMFPIIEETDVRMGDDGIQELTEMVEQLFPQPQIKSTLEVVTNEGKEAATMDQEGEAVVDNEPMETT